ncbi:hypothetical protein B0T24DRAFT_287061 [Lasiosphaeria ovina]|uniref:DUF4048 domain-containing protein n=1 Tax=Lasiosphaeria ovina TaxID=92902 RepID=A0AAE0KCD8_9PEZI|nr:hypothetical protein B0T24DRAFT_287061 [Lasiosphaeria ovina]
MKKTSTVVLQTCFVSALANALFLRDSHPLNVHKAILVARRTSRPIPASPQSQQCSSSSPSPSLSPSPSALAHWRRHRRNCAAPATPYRRRRTSCAAYYPDSLRKISHSFVLHRPPASKRPETRRPVPTETAAMEQAIYIQHSLEGLMLSQPPDPQSHYGHAGEPDRVEPRHLPDERFTPPSPHIDDSIETRSARSASTASRSTNRLSLTLPIALPTTMPSRPAPISTTSASFPPTPLDSPSLMSPVDPNDFITAIAAQERRVLELREELSCAESDLTRLKRQWTSHEAHRKRAERRNIELLRPLAPISTELIDDSATTKRNVELDKRKALLLGQQSQQGTPDRGRRRIFRGGHTRTLSLLSPTKPNGPGFSVHEDGPGEYRSGLDDSDSPHPSRFAPSTPAPPSKRASWAPRSQHQASGVKQIAQDLKTGLWTFMEDLRQATVGDEPITGHGDYLRGGDGNMRQTLSGSTSPSGYGGDGQDTIRASGANSRPRVDSVFDETPLAKDDHAEEEDINGAVPPRSARALSRSNTETSKTSKRFSWTPLTIESYEDSDWSNWDSPSVNSPRWSGSTANGDIISTIPERRNENDTPLKKKGSKPRLATTRSPRSPGPLSPTKLEELLPPVLNRLTPSNLKRTATEFMKEWEKSLYPPDQGSTSTTTTSNAAAAAAARDRGAK